MVSDDRVFMPLTRRHGLRDAPLAAPWIRVPKLVTGRLKDWCDNIFRGDFHPIYKTIPHPDDYYFEITDLGISLATSLNLDLPVNCYFRHGPDLIGNAPEVRWVEPSPSRVIRDAISAENDTALDIVDFMLRNRLATDKEISELAHLLAISNSAWTVSENLDGLTSRMSSEEAANAERTIDDALNSGGEAIASAGQHLRDAHKHAWTRSSMNPQSSYQSAVMAIESALREIVSPGYPDARINNIATQLRLPKNQWHGRIGGQGTAVCLAKLLELVAGEQDRHGQITYEVNDIAEAQDAVTLATAIVGLADRGFLARDRQTEPYAVSRPPSE